MIAPYGPELERPILDQLTRTFGEMGFQFPEDALRAYARHLFDHPDRKFIRNPAGMAELHPLAWDSSIYGRRIGFAGLLALLPGQDASCLADEIAAVAREAGFEMLVTRFELRELPLTQALEARGFQTMDVQSPLFFRVQPSPPAASPFRIRDLEPADIPRIVAFGKSVFSRSHLYADPLLPAGQTDQLHQRWLENDCTGRAWFSLVAVDDDDEPCGFVTGLWDDHQEQLLGLRHGHIDLLAVKDSHRGKSMGRHLVAAAVERFATRHADLVTISTQATNLPAIRLYLRAGFQLAAPQITFHGWLAGSHA